MSQFTSDPDDKSGVFDTAAADKRQPASDRLPRKNKMTPFPFCFIAKDASGRQVKGELVAEHFDQASEILRTRGYSVARLFVRRANISNLSYEGELHFMMPIVVSLGAVLLALITWLLLGIFISFSKRLFFIALASWSVLPGSALCYYLWKEAQSRAEHRYRQAERACEELDYCTAYSLLQISHGGPSQAVHAARIAERAHDWDMARKLCRLALERFHWDIWEAEKAINRIDQLSASSVVQTGEPSTPPKRVAKPSAAKPRLSIRRIAAAVAVLVALFGAGIWGVSAYRTRSKTARDSAAPVGPQNVSSSIQEKLTQLRNQLADNIEPALKKLNTDREDAKDRLRTLGVTTSASLRNDPKAATIAGELVEIVGYVQALEQKKAQYEKSVFELEAMARRLERHDVAEQAGLTRQELAEVETMLRSVDAQLTGTSAAQAVPPAMQTDKIIDEEMKKE